MLHGRSILYYDVKPNLRVRCDEYNFTKSRKSKPLWYTKESNYSTLVGVSWPFVGLGIKTVLPNPFKVYYS